LISNRNEVEPKLPSVCPRCGHVGYGIFMKTFHLRGRVYRYEYFAHPGRKGRHSIRWCYLPKNRRRLERLDERTPLIRVRNPVLEAVRR